MVKYYSIWQETDIWQEKNRGFGYERKKNEVSEHACG